MFLVLRFFDFYVFLDFVFHLCLVLVVFCFLAFEFWLLVFRFLGSLVVWVLGFGLLVFGFWVQANSFDTTRSRALVNLKTKSLNSKHLKT